MVMDVDKNNSHEIKISDDDEQNFEHERDANKNVLEAITNKEDNETETTKYLESNKYLDQLQRLQAEFMNYKKRVEKERLELSDLFKSELVGSLLPVIDDFERMLDHSNGENNEFLKGVKLIYQKFIDVLKEQGLKTINAKGQKFDPRLHEAMLTENTENGDDEIVAEEWRKGYLFNDRLLRPAQVKVLKSEKVDES
jgi:molecular chaperone GrpE